MAGRRGKWLVLAFWIVLLVVFAPLGSKLADKTQDDTESFLPKNAESTKVVRALDKDFKAGETSDGLIVYQREGGLTAADKDKIRRGRVPGLLRDTGHATTGRAVPAQLAAAASSPPTGRSPTR